MNLSDEITAFRELWRHVRDLLSDDPPVNSFGSDKSAWHFVKRDFRFFWQRRTQGWDDSETWNLDVEIARFAVPRLKVFRQQIHSHPPDLTFEEWQAKLDEVIWALEHYANPDKFERSVGFTDDDWKRLKYAMKTFGRRFGDLWD